MKKKILCLGLLLSCTLSACGSSGQNPTNSNDTNQSASSTEVSTTEATVTPEDNTTENMPTVYTELLDKYATALKEKWDGTVLMEQGLNIITLDLYYSQPLDNIGYAVIDIDGNGTDELVIGTTAMVTDDFYGKIIFDLYTVDKDGSRVQVLSSTVRNRYFYVGEQLFVNLGSNSSDDSINTILRYDDNLLSDANDVKTSGDYVQMDLTPLSLWKSNTVSDMENTKDNSSSELVGVLDEINDHVTPGTAGSSLSAVPVTVKLLNWGVSTDMTTDAISNTVNNWISQKGNDELVAFSEKMSLINATYKDLLGDNAKDLLSSAGCDDAPYPWSDKPIDTIEVIMDIFDIS